MALGLQEIPAQSETDDGDELHHWYCCDENKAWCGTDISGHAEVPEDPTDGSICQMCMYMARFACKRCGDW